MSEKRISTRKKKIVYNEDFDYNQMKRRKKDPPSKEVSLFNHLNVNVVGGNQLLLKFSQKLNIFCVTSMLKRP